jgi:hypothetical protein
MARSCGLRVGTGNRFYLYLLLSTYFLSDVSHEEVGHEVMLSTCNFERLEIFELVSRARIRKLAHENCPGETGICLHQFSGTLIHIQSVMGVLLVDRS